jgi:hypothetical protein
MLVLNACFRILRQNIGLILPIGRHPSETPDFHLFLRGTEHICVSLSDRPLLRIRIAAHLILA